MWKEFGTKKESLASNLRARHIFRSRNRGVKIREPVVKEVSVLDGGSIGIIDVSSWSVSGSAVNAGESMTNLSHEHSKSNINNIISRSSSVGESSEISSNNSQRIL